MTNDAPAAEIDGLLATLALIRAWQLRVAPTASAEEMEQLKPLLNMTPEDAVDQLQRRLVMDAVTSVMINVPEFDGYDGGDGFDKALEAVAAYVGATIDVGIAARAVTPAPQQALTVEELAQRMYSDSSGETRDWSAWVAAAKRNPDGDSAAVVAKYRDRAARLVADAAKYLPTSGTGVTR
ncbi:hypothetical protein [Leifsonia sp. Leaf264]|uniref:hypothetical protein n=1 Tax=Leifsonia sp. Leaf264 TaxID=1736314 RepID=UPI0006F1D2A6|nr:hypothetical protein [Leifsonia sp. Leaf264]KQO98415.1 hypothetical protein ASF30_10160 [Leifsonia sp. Leaf264]